MVWLLCFFSIAFAAIPFVTLRNGVQVPMIAMGSGGLNDSSAESTIRQALSVGFTHIDTAYDYHDQTGVGRALKSVNRSSVFVTSKVPGCGVPGLPPYYGVQPPCFNNTMRAALTDLQQLDTPYLDMLLLHFPPVFGCHLPDECSKMQQQWEALEDLYNDKKVRAIGVSNYCQNCIECLLKTAKVLPMLNQVQYHVGMGADPDGLMSYCEKEQIIVEAYSPLAGGRLLSNFSVGKVIAAKYNISTAQVAMAYIAQRGHVLVTKTTNFTYAKEDLDLWSFVLDTTDLQQLDSINNPQCQIEAPVGCCPYFDNSSVY
jgi:diketogulonate reductase-like aldo/keto reductase